MNVGVSLGFLNPRLWPELSELADRLGFESVWVPEHLILPVHMESSPRPGESHPPIPPNISVFDPWAYLAFLAGRTERIRLGTVVYNIGLRHPFVTARAVQTVDVVSGGRVEFGIGASWLRSEWEAVGLDFGTRGRRVDEALEICRRLWSEEVVEHHGEFFDFDPVMFEPKPLQQPSPPVHVGGVSDVAYRRAARDGDGWIGMNTTPEEVLDPLRRLRDLRRDSPRADEPLEITVLGAAEGPDDLERWQDVGVTRLLLNNLGRSSGASAMLERRADQLFG